MLLTHFSRRPLEDRLPKDLTYCGRYGEALMLGANTTVPYMYGVSIKTWQRWGKTGVPWTAADAVAIRLGVHPGSIWPEWFADLWDPCPELEARWARIDWLRDARRVLDESWEESSCLTAA